MAAHRVHEFLDENGIAYEVQDHERAVSAQRLAAVEHVSGWDVAKPVLLSVGDELVMAVVPGAVDVDLDKAQAVIGGNEVRLAAEDEFTDVFSDCEPGAEPPFGNLYGIPVFLDEKLRARRQMICRDGSHTRTFAVATDDYLRAVAPEVVDISAEAH